MPHPIVTCDGCGGPVSRIEVDGKVYYRCRNCWGPPEGATLDSPGDADLDLLGGTLAVNEALADK